MKRFADHCDLADYAVANGLEFTWEGTRAFQIRLRDLAPDEFEICEVATRKGTTRAGLCRSPYAHNVVGFAPARRHDWLARLARVVAKHEAAPFDWAGSHCFAFVMEAAIEMTGDDPHRGAWRVKTARGARLAMARRGFADVADALAAVFPEVAPAFARTGDAVVVPSGLPGVGPVCGLVVGDALAVRAEDGFARLPRSRATRAFKIG